LVALAALLSVGVGCGFELEPGDFGNGQGEGPGGGVGGAEAQEGQGGQAGEPGDPPEPVEAGGDPSGPSFTIRFRANTDPFPHADGLSGQTPIAHSSGVRKLQLFKGSSDPSPVTIFDFGQGFVEIGYDHGDDTAVYTAAAATLPAGTYTLARVVHSHVRYRVASTMHLGSLGLPGQFDNLQVLSDGTIIDGKTRDHGYFEYSFEAGGQQYAASGNDAPVPQWPETGGFAAKLEAGEWAYYFEVFLPVTPNVPTDLDIVLEVNMFESYRWADQDQPGFTPDVFDTTPQGFEPVMRFGANSFALLVEPSVGD